MMHVKPNLTLKAIARGRATDEADNDRNIAPGFVEVDIIRCHSVWKTENPEPEYKFCKNRATVLRNGTFICGECAQTRAWSEDKLDVKGR